MICSRKILLFIILNTPLAIVAQVSELRDLRAALESGVNAPEKAKIYARLGMLYTERSVDSSLYFGTKALDLAREVQYDEVEARAKSVLAFCYMEQGKPFLAYKFAAEALATFEQLGLKEQTAEMHMNIGVLLMKEGNLRDAVPKFDLAYQESLKLDKDSIRSLIILNMISSKQDQLSLSQIENHYQDALTIARNYGDTRMEVLIRHSRASIMLRKGVPIQQVRGELKGVLEETKSLGYDYLQAISLMELAQVYLLDHLDTSLMHIQSALDLTENLGYDQMHFHMLNHAFQMLSTIEPVPPQLATIGERMKELAALRSKEFQNDGLGFLQLALREKELEVQQAKVAVRRQWAVFLSIAGTLAILIAAWATYQYSLKRRLTNKLRKALEELRVKNKQLEDNDLFNTRLIAVLSHDLRSPFASMVMMSSDILNELSPQEQKSIYEDMRRSSKVSLQVIDGLLHWMKLQTVGLAVTPSELNIKACIEQLSLIHI